MTKNIATICTRVSIPSYWGRVQTRWVGPHGAHATECLNPLILGQGSDGIAQGRIFGQPHVSIPSYWGRVQTLTRKRKVNTCIVSIPSYWGRVQTTKSTSISAYSSRLNPLILGQGSDGCRKTWTGALHCVSIPSYWGRVQTLTFAFCDGQTFGLNPLILGQGSDGQALRDENRVKVSIPSYWGRVQTNRLVDKIERGCMSQSPHIGAGFRPRKRVVSEIFEGLNPLILGQGSDVSISLQENGN